MSTPLKLDPLKPLDLRQATTVGGIVRAMSQCSFGARMLGEVALKILGWIQENKPICVVYDGTQLLDIFEKMRGNGWVREVVRSDQVKSRRDDRCEHLVVGRFSESRDEDVYGLSGAIYINKEELVPPGLVRDGYFPDVVFAHPGFAVPTLYCALKEWVSGQGQSTTDLFRELANYPFGKTIVNGVETLGEMVSDPECTVFLTLSGAMTIAMMGLVICDLIDLGMVDVVSSTGALMAHGLIESVGLKHYKHNPGHNDAFLAGCKLNRVTDTLEPEENFSYIEKIVDEVLWALEADQPISPSKFHAAVGEYLATHYPSERGPLKSAYEKNVPVLCPAFVDSEIGNDLYVHNERRRRAGRPPVVVWPELDSQILLGKMTGSKRAGIFSVGGGVPRNNTQNVAPLIEIANERLGLDMPARMFFYGCRIAPDAMYYGHLSGSTYSENGSWRKMDIQNGRFAEIRGDATQIWPFMVRHVMERLL